MDGEGSAELTPLQMMQPELLPDSVIRSNLSQRLVSIHLLDSPRERLIDLWHRLITPLGQRCAKANIKPPHIHTRIRRTSDKTENVARAARSYTPLDHLVINTRPRRKSIDNVDNNSNNNKTSTTNSSAVSINSSGASIKQISAVNISNKTSSNNNSAVSIGRTSASVKQISAVNINNKTSNSTNNFVKNGCVDDRGSVDSSSSTTVPSTGTPSLHLPIFSQGRSAVVERSSIMKGDSCSVGIDSPSLPKRRKLDRSRLRSS